MDPGFSGTKLFWVQVFQCLDFSGSGSRFQILCLGPGFTNSYIYFFLQQHFSLFFTLEVKGVFFYLNGALFTLKISNETIILCMDFEVFLKLAKLESQNHGQ